MPLTAAFEEKKPGAYVIHVDGSLDTNTYSILEKQVDQILARTPRVIIFDM